MHTVLDSETPVL